jgi:carbonic anhydrase
MRDAKRLFEGYQKFRAETFLPQQKIFENLARHGQRPHTMVIGCCDSRVDPTAVFNAGPGELFVMRNVANLVPPYEPQGEFHGTSAAIDFAVNGLGVEDIVILGHAGCGGIKAYLDGTYDPDKGGGAFIQKWMSLLRAARGTVVANNPGQAPEILQRELEQAGVVSSLGNLMSFAFVTERVAAGTLAIHGAYFDIATGDLQAYDRKVRRFESLTDDKIITAHLERPPGPGESREPGSMSPRSWLDRA